MERDKPFQTISELIALLKSRELHIEDEIQQITSEFLRTFGFVLR